MSTTPILAEIEICDDCLMTHACGVASDDPDYTPDREPLGLLNGAEIAALCHHDGDGCIAFSRLSCDGCGSALGGARHRMAVLSWGRS